MSAPESNSWKPINLALIADKPPLEPTIGNSRLVYPGTRHIFSGEPETCKTIAAYTTALEEVRAGGRVLIADFEMGPDMAKQRLRELGATDDELGALLYVEPDRPPTKADYADLIEGGLRLGIFDSAAGAYDVADLDDNKRRDAERFAALFIRPLWQANIATIALDHVTKAKETRGRYSIGSERKLGGSDVHLGFETVKPFYRGSKGIVKILVHKDRPAYLRRPHVADLHLTSDPKTYAITWTFKAVSAGSSGSTDEWKPTHLMERVSRYLESQPEAVSRNEIDRDVSGKRGYLLSATDHLIADGYAQEHDGPRGARLVSSIGNYRDTIPPVPEAPPVPDAGYQSNGPTGSPPVPEEFPF